MDSVLIDKRVTSVISDKNNLFSYRKIQPLLDKDEPIYLFFVRGLDERVCLGRSCEDADLWIHIDCYLQKGISIR